MKPITPSLVDIENLKQKLSYQFCLTQSELDLFIPPTIKFEHSRNTGRLRFIYFKDQLWGMIRPNDGFFLFTPHSANYFIKHSKFPKLRVVVQNEVSEFIQQGRNVFSKHVVDCDPNLLPFSEVIVVNEKDSALAIGKVLLNRDEMLSFNTGVAVKVRKGI